VTHYSFAADPGLTMTSAPANLTAKAVTPRLLKDLGLPSVYAPGSAAGRHVAAEAVSLKRRATAPAECLSKGTMSAPVRPARTKQAGGSRAAHFDSFNWAGYALTESNFGSGINGVTGSWVVGNSNTPAGDTPSAEDTWIGIGGNIGGEGNGWGLIQEGTSMLTDYGFQSWFEYLGTSGASVSILYQGTVRPGDTVSGQVWWESSTAACFYFNDFTRGTGGIATCKSGLTIPYDHTSAEWINETRGWSGWLDQGWCPPADNNEDCLTSGNRAGEVDLEYYDDPGSTVWTDQSLTSAFGNSSADNGPWHSPFSYPFQSEVMSSDPNSGATACSSGLVLSAPTGASTNSSGGTSTTITCAGVWDGE
jgi:hypothetical protein